MKNLLVPGILATALLVGCSGSDGIMSGVVKQVGAANGISVAMGPDTEAGFDKGLPTKRELMINGRFVEER